MILETTIEAECQDLIERPRGGFPINGEKMKIASFNVNGIRARLHQVEKFVETHRPDVVGLQEIKVVDDAFPVKAFDDMGYHVDFFGQKGHYGVALMSLKKAVDIRKGFPGDDELAQRRLIAGTYQDDKGKPFVIINGYFPQGESRDHPTKFPAKQKFYADLLDYLKSDFKKTDNLVIMGDMNIAPGDNDIGIGPINAKRWLKTGKCCFLPEEREWLEALVNWGLVDLYRKFSPDVSDTFSWFDYRSKGFEDDPKRGLRIDLLLASKAFSERFTDSGIDLEIRAMEKPSDHAPVWATFE